MTFDVAMFVSQDVCNGMVNLVGQQLFHILNEAHGAVTSKDICGMIEEGKCALQSQRINNWRLDIPDLDRKQPVPVPKYPKTAQSTQKILHLSDPHVQKDYEVLNLSYDLTCSRNASALQIFRWGLVRTAVSLCAARSTTDTLNTKYTLRPRSATTIATSRPGPSRP